MENIEKHECWIGVLHDYEDTRIVDLEELKRHIAEMVDYAEWTKKFGVDNKPHLLSDYCDKRKNTDVTRFEYCPICGKKIAWKAIKKEGTE